MDKDESKVVDAVVNWKAKKVFRKNNLEQPQEGYFLQALEGGASMYSEDAEAYMQRLIELSGLDVSQMTGWRDSLRVARTELTVLGTRINPGLTVPHGTLYLMVNVHHRDKRRASLKLRQPLDVRRDLDADPEMQECVRRMVTNDKIYRVWLDVRDKQFSPAKPLEYDTPMARLQTKPQHVERTGYRFRLTPMDLVRV